MGKLYGSRDFARIQVLPFDGEVQINFGKDLGLDFSSLCR
jgi:hypothetical protein